MALRFRRSLKLAPAVRRTMTKTGIFKPLEPFHPDQS